MCAPFAYGAGLTPGHGIPIWKKQGGTSGPANPPCHLDSILQVPSASRAKLRSPLLTLYENGVFAFEVSGRNPNRL